MPRHTAAISAHRKKLFLAAFAKCGVLRQAAEMSGVPDRSHYLWIAKSAQYRQAFKVAEEQAIQGLEIELRRRACDGYSDPVFFQGRQVGEVRRYSDVLLMFLLKSRRPDIYREVRETRLSGGVNHSHSVTVVHELHDGPAALPPPTSYTPALPPARIIPPEDGGDDS